MLFIDSYLPKRELIINAVVRNHGYKKGLFMIVNKPFKF